jgi:hyperosmotically inducible protein
MKTRKLLTIGLCFVSALLMGNAFATGMDSNNNATQNTPSAQDKAAAAKQAQEDKKAAEADRKAAEEKAAADKKEAEEKAAADKKDNADNNKNASSKESTKQYFSDSEITAKVKEKFIKEKLFGKEKIAAMGVHVKTKKGVVTLRGTVATQDEADNAVNLAKSVEGIKDVVSKLKVKEAKPK